MEATVYPENRLRDVVVDAWWLVLLRGIAAVFFGLIAFFMPAETLITMAYFLGVYIFIDGLLTIIAAIRDSSDVNWGFVALRGGLGILIGIIVFAMPVLFSAVTGLYLLYLIAIFAMFSGIVDVISGWRLRRQIDDEVWMIIGGILAFLLGVLILAAPFVFGLAVVRAIGAMAVIFGISLMSLAFRVRNLREAPHLEATV